MNTMAFLNNAFCVQLMSTMAHFIWQGTILGIIGVLLMTILLFTEVIENFGISIIKKYDRYLTKNNLINLIKSIEILE